MIFHIRYISVKVNGSETIQIYEGVNVRNGHSKGHQLKDGKIFAVGEYQSLWPVNALQEQFINNSYFCLEELLQLLKEKTELGVDEQTGAAEIHRDKVMAWFYRHVSDDGCSDRYNSHTVCFCCLFEPPEHALPCSHILYSQCIMTYGRRQSKTVIEMQGCPLETHTRQLYNTWRIHLKPESAGVRVLCLDGYVQASLCGCLADSVAVVFEGSLNLKSCARLNSR